jgi:TetR/AcrR family acrAB operon transcriptional repressor
MYDRILDAAEWCFCTLGGRTSISVIASRAGCSRRQLFDHFEDRLDILHAVLGRGYFPLLERLDAVARGRRNYLPALRDALRQSLHDVQSQPHLLNALKISFLLEDAGEQHMVLPIFSCKEQARLLMRLNDIFILAFKSGELRPHLFPKTCADLVGHTLIGAIRLHVSQSSDADLEQRTLAELDLALSAMTTATYACSRSA